MAKNSKQGFILGAAILSASTIIVKVLGLVFTISIANIVPIEDITYFYKAYDVIGVFMVVASTGLPVAVSKMVSQAYALDRRKEGERVFNVSAWLFFWLGLISSVLMFVFAPQFSRMMIAGDENGKYAIMALAPNVFLYSLIAPIRGYFQGRSNVVPTAISQIIEAVVKLMIGIPLSAVIMSALERGEFAAAGAIIGVTVSTGIAAFFLYYYKNKQKKKDRLDKTEYSSYVSRKKEILISIIKFAVPIIAGSALLQILYLVDSAIVADRLKNAAMFPGREVNRMIGLYGNATKFYDLPTSFIVAFTSTLLPVLTNAVTRNAREEVTGISTISIRITLLISVPCAVGLILFGTPLSGLMYYGDGVAEGTGMLLSAMATGIIFNSVVLMANSILQSFGKVYIPVITMSLGAVIRIVLDWTLTGIHDINIMGVPIAIVVSILINMVLNLFAIYKCVPDMQNFFKMLFPPLAASVVMGALSYGVYFVLCKAVSSRIAVLLAIIVAVAVYFVFALIFKALKKEDILMMPKGEKIAKILKMQ